MFNGSEKNPKLNKLSGTRDMIIQLSFQVYARG